MTCVYNYISLQPKLYAHILQTYLTLWQSYLWINASYLWHLTLWPSYLRSNASLLWHLPLLWRVEVKYQQKLPSSWSPQKANFLGILEICIVYVMSKVS